MIVIDTSVWIEFFKGRNQNLVKKIRELLDEESIYLPRLVFLEILNGVGKNSIAPIKRVFSALPFLEADASTWLKVEEWILKAANKGQRFGVIDLLIAAQAYENKAAVWSLDSDFKRMVPLEFTHLWSL
jgi:predicted nucleic acid-binding protein